MARTPRGVFFFCHEKTSLRLRLVYGLILLLAFSGLFTYAFHRVMYEWNWPGLWDYRDKFLTGWLVTIGISAASLILSTLIGIIAALSSRSRLLILRTAIPLYVELVRGTPLLVQIMLLFYVIGTAFQITNRYVAGIIILSLFAGAYICEIVRAGIDSIGLSQRDAARAVGFTPCQAYRHVIFPQAFRRSLPPLAGQLVSLVKDSSLLSIIAINEFTLNAREVNAYTYSTLESYIPLAIGYLVLTLPLSILTRYLEKRFRYET